MSIEEQLNILNETVSKILVLSNHLEAEITNKVSFTELEEILTNLYVHYSNHFVPHSTYNSLQKQITNLKLSLEHALNAIEIIDLKLQTNIGVLETGANKDSVTLDEVNHLISESFDRIYDTLSDNLSSRYRILNERIDTEVDKLNDRILLDREKRNGAFRSEISILENRIENIIASIERLES